MGRTTEELRTSWVLQQPTATYSNQQHPQYSQAQLGIAAEGDGWGAAGIEGVGGKVFVNLPTGAEGGAVGFDPLGDGVENGGILVLGPFGMEPDGDAVAEGFADYVGVFRDGLGGIDDDFDFIGAGEVFGERELPPLGAEGDPVEVAL